SDRCWAAISSPPGPAWPGCRSAGAISLWTSTCSWWRPVTAPCSRPATPPSTACHRLSAPSSGRPQWGGSLKEGLGMADRAPSGMRRFTMSRQHDASGVSGTGNVLEGVLFSTGVVVIHWLTPPPRGSISVFDSMDQFLSIHVRPHPGNHTVLTFEDGQELASDDLAEERYVVLP